MEAMMPSSDLPARLSLCRHRLCSFDHAYKIALNLRRDTGIPHYVIRGIVPLQAYRVTTRPPVWPDRWLAMAA
ncbi:hypothetical protein [Sphingobium sp. Z007]|uniref:hypothetical protein n=1 Tax=Sphingobium sp. Z007 TaxID=627495 RepID=UPI000B49E61A|nr:hypothetical protein [Sphingobium sp. Z007]